MEEEPDLIIDRPNRRKPASLATRAIVVLLLVVSAVLMLIVAIGGWSELLGLKVILIAWLIIYLIMAFYVAQWRRGMLPLAATLAVILGILAAIAAPTWFDRDATGFAQAETIFGGNGLSADVLGLITVLLIPIQILLIGFAARGFTQGWHVEIERPADGVPGDGDAATA